MSVTKGQARKIRLPPPRPPPPAPPHTTRARGAGTSLNFPTPLVLHLSLFLSCGSPAKSVALRIAYAGTMRQCCVHRSTNYGAIKKRPRTRSPCPRLPRPREHALRPSSSYHLPISACPPGIPPPPPPVRSSSDRSSAPLVVKIFLTLHVGEMATSSSVRKASALKQKDVSPARSTLKLAQKPRWSFRPGRGTCVPTPRPRPPPTSMSLNTQRTGRIEPIRVSGQVRPGRGKLNEAFSGTGAVTIDRRTQVFDHVVFLMCAC